MEPAWAVHGTPLEGLLEEGCLQQQVWQKGRGSASTKQG